MKVLYCGDDELASLYLLGGLDYLGHTVSHVIPSAPFPGVGDEDLLILSDYRAERIATERAAEIRQFVSRGGKLLMLGGWDSFNGLGNNYYGHELAEILPVELEGGDDRRNVSQGLIIRRAKPVGLASDLAWREPPVIGGYNAARAKKSARVIVQMSPIISDGSAIRLGNAIPLVITQNFERGCVTACLCDLAPHWSGGLVDWGRGRLKLSSGREVGSDYVGFLDMLLNCQVS